MNEKEEKSACEQVEDDRVELKMHDAFGHAHNILALSKKRIEERLDEIWENRDTYIKKACEYHIPGKNTEVLLDLETGEVSYARYSHGTGAIFDPSIVLFTIEHDIWSYISWDDIFDPEELKEAKGMLQNDEIKDYEEYAEKKGIDLDERLAVCIEQWISEDDYYFSEVKKVLDEIYAREVED